MNKALQKTNFRFIRLQGQTKIPCEKNWQKTKNYSFDSVNWTDNTGVACGFGGLVVFDNDKKNNPEAFEKAREKIRALLPKTFAVKTPSGGEHYYFVVAEQDAQKVKLLNGVGELQGRGSQVVAPGSIVGGIEYTVIEQCEIAHVEIGALKSALSEWWPRQENKNLGAVYGVEQKVSIMEVIDASNFKKNGDEFFGAHPIHGSTGGMNFWVNPEKNCWHCFRCDSGGGPLKWVAVSEGIIQCAEARGIVDATLLAKATKNFEHRTGKKIFSQTYANGRPGEKQTTKPVDRERSEITEELAQRFMEDRRVYTLRNDLKDEIWVYDSGIYVPNGRTFIREFCRTELGEKYSPYLVSDVVHKIAVDSFIDEEEFFRETNPDEIAVQNGILNLKTRELSDFTPDKKFFGKSPAYHNPTAACPTIEKHLDAVLKNPTDKTVIFELFGFCLEKKYFLEKAFMMLGDGRNGKSKTLELLKNFLGPENCVSVPLQQLESEQFARSELFNKMANLCGDISKTALKTTGIFKQLTGGDLISADRKFLPRVHFRNFAKLVFACNELPHTGDLTLAFWNRWILLEFPYTFLPQKELDAKLADPDFKEEERTKLRLADPEIIAKLIEPEELSGLLNAALDGLDRIHAKRDFSFSRSTYDVKTLWLRKSDSISVFVEERIEAGDINDDSIQKLELKRNYIRYCKREKLRVENDAAVRKALLAAFEVTESQHPNDERKRVRHWDGIRWKPESAQATQATRAFSTTLPPKIEAILPKITPRISLADGPEKAVLPVQGVQAVGVAPQNHYFPETHFGKCAFCGNDKRCPGFWKDESICDICLGIENVKQDRLANSQ